MPTRRIPPTALLRGWAVGVSTAILTAAAHAAAGGGLPSGVGSVQLALLGLTIGVTTATLRHGDRFVVLAVALATGQVVGHVLLGAVGHQHGAADATSGAVMLVAHVAAVLAITALVAVGEVSCRAVSRALGATRPLPSSPIPAPHAGVVRRCDHPMRSSLLLAASSSYRGPPVSAVR
ncbi:hypothetical protein [Mycolicibacterium sediminis]|uniref:Uncharacterized protein n=1 Tax=Mycolicibacterium sediminis TaxID=1286180 RepID=A0A7I7QJU3_9MYCO|nr:hypothetical protein [Mycolicibacterium sediminis]BBY26583.1 hypothetical protein MSEDJ_06790 [Mycolicibacterium sediminis]